MTEVKRTHRKYTKLQKDHAIAYLLVTGCCTEVVARRLGMPEQTLCNWAKARLGATSQAEIQRKRAAGDYGVGLELDTWLKDKLKAGKHFVLTS